jgi:hypothetical protein
VSTLRFSLLVMAACFVLAFAADASLRAQPDPEVLQQQLRNWLPQGQEGHTIDDSQVIWVYVAAVVGFIIVFALTWILVRILAVLIILACFLGGIATLCWMIHEGWFTTWEQLGWITLYLAVSGGVTAITASLFLLKGPKAPGDVQAQQTRMQQEIEVLSRDLRALRDRAGRA